MFKVPAAGCYFDPENDCTENKSWVTGKGFKTKWWDNTCNLRDLKVVRCCYLTLGARSFSCAVSSFGKCLYSDLSFCCGFAPHVINTASGMLKIQDMVARYQDLELTNSSPPPLNFGPWLYKTPPVLEYMNTCEFRKKEGRGEFHASPFPICQHHFDVNVVVQFRPWFKLIIIHYHSQKQGKIKIKPRIKLNHSINKNLKIKLTWYCANSESTGSRIFGRLFKRLLRWVSKVIT